MVFLQFDSSKYFNNNSLSLKTNEIILANVANDLISIKSAIILSISLFGNLIATNAKIIKIRSFK